MKPQAVKCKELINAGQAASLSHGSGRLMRRARLSGGLMQALKA
jgi:hypothetical protein